MSDRVDVAESTFMCDRGDRTSCACKEPCQARQSCCLYGIAHRSPFNFLEAQLRQPSRHLQMSHHVGDSDSVVGVGGDELYSPFHQHGGWRYECGGIPFDDPFWRDGNTGGEPSAMYHAIQQLGGAKSHFLVTWQVSRISVYENDVLGTFSIPNLYGHGMRVYLLGKIKLFNSLSIYARIGGSFLSEETKIDLKAEVIWRSEFR